MPQNGEWRAFAILAYYCTYCDFKRQPREPLNQPYLPRPVPKSIPYSIASHLRSPTVVMRRQSDPNALVLVSGGLPGQAASWPSLQQPGEQGPITHGSQINAAAGYIHCQEHRYFSPNFNYEVVRVQARYRNAHVPSETFHILNFPIDQLGGHLIANATQLLNLRSITFCGPLSWEAFITNYMQIMQMALCILTHVSESLTKITLCADMLNDELFRVLGSQLRLREVEIVLPPISFDFPDRLDPIRGVLNRGVTLLGQVESLKIPLELVTSELLSCLGRLPRLYFLKTTGSTNNSPYPGRSFVRRMDHRYTRNPRFFESLQLLDVRGNLPREDFFSKDILSDIFPNTKFIKT